jgi:4-hydroxy 2-oxovalerate aldolase
MELINVDYVEIGFINKSNNYKNELVGVVRNLDEETINKFQNKKFKISVMADYADIDMELLNKNINIDLVRVAFHKNDLIPALNICKEIKNLGYKVSVNAMAITNYNEDELKFLFNEINQYNLDILYIADSYGSLSQKNIKYYLELFKNNLNNAIIGLHLHNNLNNAYSNYESLYNVDYDLFIDSTLFGMGRGAGNLQTELVIINKEIIDFDNLINNIGIHTFCMPVRR